MHVSVIVPTYRRPELLERTLDSLISQTFPADEFEILVADDAPDALTRRVVEHASRLSTARSGPSLRYLACGTARGPAAARNRACRDAMGSILAFTDDDTIPASHWLRAGVAAIEAGADAVAGHIDVPLTAARPTDYERDAARLAQAEFATANCFVRADAFRSIGGFDERFAVAWREDSDLQFRLLDAGYRITCEPAALVVHPVRPAPWGISLRQQRKSQYNALLYKKHGHRYREHIQRRPPIGYYLTIGTLMGSIGMFRRNRALAAGSIIAWVLLTMRLTLHRLAGAAITASHIAEMSVTSAVIPLLSVFWRLKGAARFKVIFL